VSEFWNSGEEVFMAMMSMYAKAAMDPVIIKKSADMKFLTLYEFTDPDVKIWIDSRGEIPGAGMGDPPDAPDITVSIAADDAHRNWSGKLNLMLAIARNRMRLGGKATKMLKMATAAKRMTAAYNEGLREMGKADIILE